MLNKLSLIMTLLFPILLFTFMMVINSEASSILFETIITGSHSDYRYGDDTFKGVDMLIKNRSTWKRFWKLHDKIPPISLPEINFNEEIVIVTILGWQSTMGPGIKILGVYWIEKSYTQKVCKK